MYWRGLCASLHNRVPLSRTRFSVSGSLKPLFNAYLWLVADGRWYNPQKFEITFWWCSSICWLFEFKSVKVWSDLPITVLTQLRAILHHEWISRCVLRKPCIKQWTVSSDKNSAVQTIKTGRILNSIHAVTSGTTWYESGTWMHVSLIFGQSRQFWSSWRPCLWLIFSNRMKVDLFLWFPTRNLTFCK